jgi:hypothetical protein
MNETPPREITFADNVRFIFKILARAVRYAFEGIYYIGSRGGLHGLWLGALNALFFHFINFVDAGMVIMSIITGAVLMAAVGALSGSSAFFVIGLLSYSAHDLHAVIDSAVERARKPGFWGIIAGGATGTFNLIAYAMLFSDKAQGSMQMGTRGFAFGVMAGYAFGSFYGAVDGALKEIRRQRQTFYAPQ